jgi:hypothetical protein
LAFGDDISKQCEEYQMRSAPSAEARQYYHMQDDEAPRILETTDAVLHIPFFDNYNSSSPNTPLVLDRASNIQACKWGLAVGGVSLTSTDSNFVSSSFDFVDEHMCREQGIAQFTRTWTTADECGNSQTYTQTIILDHPPEGSTLTGLLTGEIHSFAPGVTQAAARCGKLVSMGNKTFEAEPSVNIFKHQCDRSGAYAWDENGGCWSSNCRGSNLQPHVG